MGGSISKVSCSEMSYIHHKKHKKSLRRHQVRIDKTKIGIPTDFRASTSILFLNFEYYPNLFPHISTYSIHTMSVRYTTKWFRKLLDTDNIFALQETIVQ